MLSPHFLRRSGRVRPQTPGTQVTKEVTREKFTNFLAWLSPGGGDDGGEAYEKLRFCLSTYFAQRRCPFPDELADETINRVIVKSSEERIENKLAYCYGVARNVYRESLRRARCRVDIEEVTLAAREPEEESFSGECLDKCLAELPDESRTLILEYFSEVRTEKIKLHRRLSESLATTQTALRMRVMRIKMKLKVCLRECMG